MEFRMLAREGRMDVWECDVFEWQGEGKMFCVYFCLGSALTQKEGNRNLGKQTKNNQVFWWLELLLSAGAEGSCRCWGKLVCGHWSHESFGGVRTKPFPLFLCKTSLGLGTPKGEFIETWIKYSSLRLKIFLDWSLFCCRISHKFFLASISLESTKGGKTKAKVPYRSLRPRACSSAPGWTA